MKSVFLLATTPTPAALSALAQGLPRDRFRLTIGLLGAVPESAIESLRASGVNVISLPLRNAWDITGIRRLRGAVQESGATLLHAFGPTAARAAGFALSFALPWSRANNNSPRFVVSGAAEVTGGLGGWFASRQIRRADRVIAATLAEGERYRAQGVPGDRLTRVAPAAVPVPPVADSAAILASLTIPPQSRLIVNYARAGQLIGSKNALVAFDMLRYDARDLYLVVYGAGAMTAELERYGQALAFDDYRVRFAPSDDTRAAVVSLATAVWITHPANGTDEPLQAMAAGKPVAGWNTRELGEIVQDGETGFLVPEGDQIALASRCRLWMDDPTLAMRMGEAGRVRAEERFPLARTLEQFARLYDELSP